MKTVKEVMQSEITYKCDICECIIYKENKCTLNDDKPKQEIDGCGGEILLQKPIRISGDRQHTFNLSESEFHFCGKCWNKFKDKMTIARNELRKELNNDNCKN
jgi:hypothetical protein